VVVRVAPCPCPRPELRPLRWLALALAVCLVRGPDTGAGVHAQLWRGVRSAWTGNVAPGPGPDVLTAAGLAAGTGPGTFLGLPGAPATAAAALPVSLLLDPVLGADLTAAVTACGLLCARVNSTGTPCWAVQVQLPPCHPLPVAGNTSTAAAAVAAAAATLRVAAHPWCSLLTAVPTPGTVPGTGPVPGGTTCVATLVPTGAGCAPGSVVPTVAQVVAGTGGPAAALPCVPLWDAAVATAAASALTVAPTREGFVFLGAGGLPRAGAPVPCVAKPVVPGGCLCRPGTCGPTCAAEVPGCGPGGCVPASTAVSVLALPGSPPWGGPGVDPGPWGPWAQDPLLGDGSAGADGPASCAPGGCSAGAAAGGPACTSGSDLCPGPGGVGVPGLPGACECPPGALPATGCTVCDEVHGGGPAPCVPQLAPCFAWAAALGPDTDPRAPVPPCSGHGRCAVETDAAFCVCTPGWAGPDCRDPVCVLPDTGGALPGVCPVLDTAPAGPGTGAGAVCAPVVVHLLWATGPALDTAGAVAAAAVCTARGGGLAAADAPQVATLVEAGWSGWVRPPWNASLGRRAPGAVLVGPEPTPGTDHARSVVCAVPRCAGPVTGAPLGRTPALVVTQVAPSGVALRTLAALVGTLGLTDVLCGPRGAPVGVGTHDSPAPTWTTPQALLAGLSTGLAWACGPGRAPGPGKACDVGPWSPWAPAGRGVPWVLVARVAGTWNAWALNTTQPRVQGGVPGGTLDPLPPGLVHRLDAAAGVVTLCRAPHRDVADMDGAPPGTVPLGMV
jgi:hypothetical protein